VSVTKIFAKQKLKIQHVKKPWALPKPTNFFEKKFDKNFIKPRKRAVFNGSRAIALGGYLRAVPNLH